MSALDRVRTNQEALAVAQATIAALARPAQQGDQVAIITRTALGTEANQLLSQVASFPVDPSRWDRIRRFIERVDEIADPVNLEAVVASNTNEARILSSPKAPAPSSSGGGAPAIALVVVILVAGLLLVGAFDV